MYLYLAVECGNDDDKYPIAKELVNCKITLFRLQDGDEYSTTLPEDYTLF